MSLTFSLSSVAPSLHKNQFKLCNLKPQRYAPSTPSCSVMHCNFSWAGTNNIHTLLRNKPPRILKSTAKSSVNPDYQSFTEENLDLEDQEDFEDTGSPWEGAVIYKRNASVSHVEYCTTLERLGLGKLSTEVSKSRASVMGLRVTKAVKDYPLGTPVQISIDVTRKKQKLRLDGILKTVITLYCNRCCEPAAECIFSNFSLVLTEEPIEEPEIINMGVIYGENKFQSTGHNGEEEEDDEALIDLEDRLYFPPEEKEIDISKHVRDMVHLEITINAICDPRCKGMCLKCGTNWNTGNCNCSKEEAIKEKGQGPLTNLRKQMQTK